MIEEIKLNKIWLKIFLGLFYLFIFFLLLKNSFGYLDPDFGWHLKTGEQIWQTGAVPNLNYENYTLEGRTWVDHEWLMNLITYLIYHNFGYIVLSIFFALLIVAALIIQLQFARKNFLRADRGLIVFLALQFLGLYASLPHLGIRMQEITVLNLLLLLIIIFYYNKRTVAERHIGLNSHLLVNFFKNISADIAISPSIFLKKFPQNLKNLCSKNVLRQPSENKNYKTLLWLLPLFMFWASAHAGFLIGFFILGLFAFTKILELLAKRFDWKIVDYKNNLTGGQIWTFIGFSFLTLIATFATPYGLKLYEFLAGCQDSFYQSHISEWQGQYFFPFQYPQLIYLEIALLFLALLFFTIFVFKREQGQKIDLWQLFLVSIFSILAFKARRHFPLLFIISAPIFAALFINFFNLRFSFLDKIKISSKLSRLLAIFILIALLLAGALVALNINFTARPEISYKNSYPLEAIKFLRAHPEWNDRRIFNDYGWGGYLIWQYPERKLFVDGRLPQYKINSATMLQEYYAFFDKEKTAVKLSEYDIGLVLLKIDLKTPKISWWEKILFGISEKKWAEAQKEGFAFRDYLRFSGLFLWILPLLH